MGKASVKNPFKTMYKGTTSKKKDGMHRPEGAGNFDNMDDYNIAKSVNTMQGTVQHTPSADKDVANKKYVDDQFPVTHASTTGQTTDDHHNESHTIVSHSDTSATGAELDTLTDNSMADTLHRHSELSASDGTPDQAVIVDATGQVGIGTTPQSKLHVAGGAIWLSANETNNSTKFNIFKAEGYDSDTETEGWCVFHARGGDGTNILAFGGSTGGENAATDIRFYTAADTATRAGTFRAAIDSSGNFGIGTLTPTIPLSTKEKSGMTAIGGFCIKLTNKTGANSIAGYCVTNDDSTADAVKLVPINVPSCIGVFLESGIADGSEAWVVVGGIADVYFWDDTTLGHLARTGLTADTGEVSGQALSEAVPTSPFSVDKHFCEIGHVLENRTGAGLARCVLHFN